ncbi:hypothetical protein IAD21_04383 [Abditibacteriota bacterium]|nr:hypothetical protein IAD21_04383 [Abditibacteriota bacterium]
MPQLSSPRRLAFRGHIEAFAWGFPRSLTAPDELPGRVLALWRSGARLEEFDWGHVLFLLTPQKVRAELAPALVLTRHKKCLVAAPPVRGDEPDDGTWVIEDGEWHALKNGRVVDVSLWLDVGTWTLPALTPLGEVPEVPTLLAPVALDLRAQSGIQAPDPKWQTIWERKSGAFSTSSFPIPHFSPSLLFGFLTSLFTPRRDAGNVPLASDRSIALSGVAVLVGSILFMELAWSNPSSAHSLPIVALFGLLLVWVFRRFITRGGNAPSQPQMAPPIVVAPNVKILSFLIIGLGVLGLALFDINRALNALFTLIVGLILGRALGITGTLLGQSSVAIGKSVSPATGTGNTRAGNNRESWLARWFRLRSQGKGTGRGGGTPGPKTRDNASDMWRRLMANAALRSGLFKTMGKAQARYLLRSMELFERGDLEAALRHAIALGGQSDGGWQPPPALGVPGLRSELNLSLANVPALSTMNFGPEVEERLRSLYRRAFEKLRDAGDIYKAAFVLADLLHSTEEAVAFLEEHRQFELAASLAEGRQLAPGLVVRAWWLAGNRGRAVQIAQLKGAFADAIVRLEKSPDHRDDAAALRLLWGHHLASQGRFASAVEAVWPLPTGRPFASKWLRLGLEENESPRLLARALATEPDCWKEWHPLLETLLSEERNSNGARRRARFARELEAQKSEINPALEVAARWTARALLRDGANDWGGVEQSIWNNLLALSGDGILRADSHWPSSTYKPAALAGRTEPLEISINGESGTLNARDAVLLENGELLVAFGEMGARLLSWDGRTKAQFDVPAHTIVRAFDAPRALLLAPRDDIWRVTKLDLGSRKAAFWGDVRASCFARHFDGATWFAGTDGRVRAFDVAAPTPSALWDSGDMNGQTIELTISRTSLAALVERVSPPNSLLPAISGNPTNTSTFESWQFELPALILRSRSTPKDFPSLPFMGRRHLTSTGEQFAMGARGLEDQTDATISTTALVLVRGEHQLTVGLKPHQSFDAVTDGEHTIILWRDERSALASLFARSHNKILAILRFEGASHVGARECMGTWLLWDDLGRVITFNPTNGNIEREWILS